MIQIPRVSGSSSPVKTEPSQIVSDAVILHVSTSTPTKDELSCKLPVPGRALNDQQLLANEGSQRVR